MLSDKHEAAVEFEFHRKGALTAQDLASATRLSQPTISRLLTRLGPRVIRFGRGRNSRYALARSVRELGSAWPLYAIDSEGKAQRVGILRTLEPRLWCLEQAEPWGTLRGNDFPDGLYPDLPWFLEDSRPQGFLGRVFARQHAVAMGNPTDPRLWSMEDVLAGLLRFGHDLPGSFVLGEAMLSVAQMEPAIGTIDHEHRSQTYVKMAESTLAGIWPGSSAAGEQPKFTAKLSPTEHALVKFSGRTERPEARRWADLLVGEHLAAQILRKNAIPAANSCILEAEGRFFLEAERFDRLGANGRRGVVSLAALDGAFLGEVTTPWRVCARRLQDAKWLSAEDASRLILLWWFGSLIANTDMHYGNVSFFLTPNRPLRLAPIYDMTPMFYRPDPEGNLPKLTFQAPPPLPEELEIWHLASEMAEAFWRMVAADPRVSFDFRGIAEANAEIVAKQRARF